MNANRKGSALTPSRTIIGVIAAGLSALLGPAAGRILFEGLFPEALWLGRPLPMIVSGGATAFLGWILWRRLITGLMDNKLGAGHNSDWVTLTPYFPLALNLVYLFDPAVELILGRFIFLAGLWLSALFLARLARPDTWRWLGFLLLVGFLLPVYLLTMGQSVGRADTFEFQVVAPRLGIVHPTGYPLYLILSKIFTYLPIKAIAWRVNLATAVYGLGAAYLVYFLGRRLSGRTIPPLLAAIVFGLSPTFWSQAIEAEVYTLHALFVAAALLLMREVGHWRITSKDQSKIQNLKSKILLSFTLGLGLTNHLTTIILLPGALLTLFFAHRAGREKQRPATKRLWLSMAAAFFLPLLLYAYLPIRWAIVNGEPMGIGRLVDWVIGGRFQGALQLLAWLRDPARYEILARLFGSEWDLAWTLPFILSGLVYLFYREWRFGLILLITWLGYCFYALSYYVPDLSVFLIPAHLIMALLWGLGLVAAGEIGRHLLRKRRFILLQYLVALAAFTPLLIIAARQTWPMVDRSPDDGRTRWGQAVLDQPLDDGAAILADSSKFPPLFYLQQAEGLRPDLDIVVLPNEAAYRAVLEERLAQSQTVYLARFLPGLEGAFHLSSAGPLTEVSHSPSPDMPSDITPGDNSFGPIDLVGYTVEITSPYAVDETALTFYWSASEPVSEILYVYTRWFGEQYSGSISGQHPANNNYPTVAWKPGDLVADYHTLPRPVINSLGSLSLQVALAPPFTPPDSLIWQNVDSFLFDPPPTLTIGQPQRIQLGPILLDRIHLPDHVRPQTNLPIQVSGFGIDFAQIIYSLKPAGSSQQSPVPSLQLPAPNPQSPSPSRAWTAQLETGQSSGVYDLVASYPGEPAVCGWLARPTTGCVLGQVEVSGLALPEGSTNFGDKIALLSVSIPDPELQPGGQWAVTLRWQALAPIEENYTVFVQVLDAEDRIVGQVDSWPLQGTLPTGQWQQGEVINDPYSVQLANDMPPGAYRLNVGWYLLETLRRLPVLDQSGLAIDDKVVLPGLSVPDG